MSQKFQKISKKSFWMPGNFKPTTKRIKNGYRLSCTLRALIQERSKIETSYSKHLREWTKLCNTVIDAGPEHGTMRNALKGILAEAECLAEIHSRVKTRLNCGDFQELTVWQNCTYSPDCSKEKKQKWMEKLFKKAQKPWIKLLKEVEKSKRHYHKKCSKHRILTIQLGYAVAEAKLTPANRKKLQKYVEKSNTKLQISREKYELSLQELTQYHPIYVNDMTALFTKCQEMEETRLSTFKSALYSVHRALQLIQDQSLSQIYEDFYHTVDNIDYQKDLEWWSRNYGANMPMHVPYFIEYPEIHNIASRLESAYKEIESPIHMQFIQNDLSLLKEYKIINSSNRCKIFEINHKSK